MNSDCLLLDSMFCTIGRVGETRQPDWNLLLVNIFQLIHIYSTSYHRHVLTYFHELHQLFFMIDVSLVAILRNF